MLFLAFLVYNYSNVQLKHFKVAPKRNYTVVFFIEP